MAKFTEHVALVDPSKKVVTFAPGDEVPEWANVGDHVTDGTTTKRAAGRPRKDDKADADQA